MSRPIRNLGRTCFKNSALQLISRITVLINFLRDRKAIDQYSLVSTKKIVNGKRLERYFYLNLKLLIAINNGSDNYLDKDEQIYPGIKFEQLSKEDKWVFNLLGEEDDAVNFINVFLNYLYPSRFDNEKESIIIPNNVLGRCRKKMFSNNGKYMFKEDDPRYTFQYITKYSLLDEQRNLAEEYNEYDTTFNIDFTEIERQPESVNLSVIRTEESFGTFEWNGKFYLKEARYFFSHYAIFNIADFVYNERQRVILGTFDDDNNIRLMHKSGNLLKYELVAVTLHSGEGGCGHYIALVNYNDQWYKYNDSVKTEVNREDMKSLYETGHFENFKANTLLYECTEDDFNVNDYQYYEKYLNDYIICNEYIS